MHERESSPQAARTAHARRREAGVRDLMRLVAGIGNAAFARLARDGGGLVPGGRVHPDVEHAIAATRGGGRSLDAATRERAAAELGDPLTDVRVHDDASAGALARSVSARAFTTGPDLYFGEGEYRPGTAEGDRLLAHELTHVVQQRGAPTTGPLEVSDPNDSLEREADAAARDIAG
jgi:hypothetical protein